MAGLSLDDKNIISGLNDNIIFVTSILIKRLWPFVDREIHGFRSSQSKSLSSPFIQVLQVKRSHWITVSTLHCDPGVVKVYDSLNNTIDLSTKCQIAAIMRCSESAIKLEFVNIQRQPNGSDCGLFALAVATELVQQRTPEWCFWDVSQMRPHLIECLSGTSQNGIFNFLLPKLNTFQLGIF